MGDDIREIETQNRALQILNSNQHSLINELDGLLVMVYMLLYISNLIIYLDGYLYTQKMS